jgi:hypothetical protein
MPDHGERMAGLEMRREHVGLEPLDLRRGPVLVVVVVIVGPTVKVEGTFVFIRLTVLVGRRVSCTGLSKQQGVGKTYAAPPVDHLPHVTRRELVEFLVAAKDDDGDVYRAEHGQLMGLLEEPVLAFQKGAGREAYS